MFFAASRRNYPLPPTASQEEGPAEDRQYHPAPLARASSQPIAAWESLRVSVAGRAAVIRTQVSTLRSTRLPCWKSAVVSITSSPGLMPFLPMSTTRSDVWWLIRCSTLTESAAAVLGAADADAIDMAAVPPASSARTTPMTANLRMASPYLYRTCRLVQASRSHVQQSAPSHHITLDSDGLIHAQLLEQFTLALTCFSSPLWGEPQNSAVPAQRADARSGSVIVKLVLKECRGWPNHDKRDMPTPISVSSPNPGPRPTRRLNPGTA